VAGGPRLPASAPAKLLEARDGKSSWSGLGRKDREGWARPRLRRPGRAEQKLETLVASAKLLLARTTGRPFGGLSREAIRRDASSSEAWLLLGRTGERIAAAARLGEDGRPNAPASLAAQWACGCSRPRTDDIPVRRRGVPAGDRAFAGAGDGRGGEAQASPLLRTLVDPKAATFRPRAARAGPREYLASFPSSPGGTRS